jgi:hypothetical protein
VFFLISLGQEHSFSSRTCHIRGALLPIPLIEYGVAILREDPIMKNVELTVNGTTLTITVDLSKDFGPSSSGKTTIIASTEGNISIPDREEKIGLNIYKKKA